MTDQEQTSNGKPLQGQHGLGYAPLWHVGATWTYSLQEVLEDLGADSGSEGLVADALPPSPATGRMSSKSLAIRSLL